MRLLEPRRARPGALRRGIGTGKPRDRQGRSRPGGPGDPRPAGGGRGAAPAPRPERRETNRLAGETSAYLRQHMHNPVDWHAWGAEALARAREEDKAPPVPPGSRAGPS